MGSWTVAWKPTALGLDQSHVARSASTREEHSLAYYEACWNLAQRREFSTNIPRSGSGRRKLATDMEAALMHIRDHV